MEASFSLHSQVLLSWFPQDPCHARFCEIQDFGAWRSQKEEDAGDIQGHQALGTQFGEHWLKDSNVFIMFIYNTYTYSPISADPVFCGFNYPIQLIIIQLSSVQKPSP